MKKMVLSVCLVSTLAGSGLSTVHADEKVKEGYYEVKKGDTLLEVADKFDISTLRLKKWNDLTTNKLKPGQKLVVSAERADASHAINVMLKPGVEAVKDSTSVESAPVEPAAVEAPSIEEVTSEAPVVSTETPVDTEAFSPTEPVVESAVETPVIQAHEAEFNQINVADYNTQQDYSLLPVSEPADTAVVSTVKKPAANHIAQVARQVAVGKSYVYGANSATQVDCSSFVQQVFQVMGKKMPRTTYDQIAIGARVTDPQPGDLVFFNDASHVGIYIGNGQMIDALNPTEGIKQRAVSYIDGTVTGYYRY
ncbi:LysM peptidoglycan-binding domain-containing protein [Macrococcus hajekii]|uniref:LysM peptidoglycan-binding domain-containing protein n=1 Tax=Macrococcus hajekii TaxID=198482 RepID=A0A4R6BIR0_9STAP|nr:NlpC/P60 family protein [Macrococcus hajekii]TDM01468.1 LysM peptidoglycan-binding domain-containing protein [Macrococcus hajekii]GGB00235.1 hypothetical protein GCM10007190_05370 [Macrococcus hajekii]